MALDEPCDLLNRPFNSFTDSVVKVPLSMFYQQQAIWWQIPTSNVGSNIILYQKVNLGHQEKTIIFVDKKNRAKLFGGILVNRNNRSQNLLNTALKKTVRNKLRSPSCAQGCSKVEVALVVQVVGGPKYCTTLDLSLLLAIGRRRRNCNFLPPPSQPSICN